MWIETHKVMVYKKIIHQSPAVRGCGLKLYDLGKGKINADVTRRARVWIETLSNRENPFRSHVTRRARVWIETVSLRLLLNKLLVTRRARVWIETIPKA